MEVIMKEIACRFSIDGEINKIYPFGSGHINDTYKVETSSNNYLLQRINHQVFQDVPGLTKNLIAVTDFLRSKVEGSAEKMEILRSIQSQAGEYYLLIDGNYWRVLEFIEDSFSYDRVEDENIAYEGGRSFGWFVKMLSNYPVNELVDTIPDFHNAFFRIQNFEDAVRKDPVGRFGQCKDLVRSLQSKIPEMKRIAVLAEKGEIPLRVTHNDTKINNVLFGPEKKGKCIIDLDTVMPGLVHFDFGDSIRTFTNTADEDEKDLDRVEMNLNYFTAFAKGFLERTKNILTPIEIDHLALSALYITFEQSIRFLSDYLLGDPYYKIKYSDHNLVRAKAQAKLLQSMENNYSEMQTVISRIASNR